MKFLIRICILLAGYILLSACSLDASLSDLTSKSSQASTPSPTPFIPEFTIQLSTSTVTSTTVDQSMTSFLTVTLNQARTVDTLFSLTESSPDGASAADYDLVANSLTVLAGQTSATMSLVVKGKTGSKDFDKRVNVELQTTDSEFSVQSRTAQFTITDSNALVLTVNPMYPVNGANWNDYVANPSSSLTFFVSPYLKANLTNFPTDTAATIYGAHAGELRKVNVSNKSTCQSLTMVDSADAFEWKCSQSQVPVFFYSVGFKKGKGLRDLLLSNGTDWKSLTVTLSETSSSIATSTAAKWWTNSVETISAAQMNSTNGNPRKFLNTPGRIYVLTQSAATTGLEVTADKVAFVTLPGVVLSNTSTLTTSSNCFGANCVLMSKNHYTWFEVNMTNSASGTYALKVESFKYSNRIHRSEFSGSSTAYGVYLITLGSVTSQSKFANLGAGVVITSSSAFDIILDSEFYKNSTGISLTSTSYNQIYNNKFFANATSIAMNAIQLISVAGVEISNSTNGITNSTSSSSLAITNSLLVNNGSGINDSSLLNMNSVSVMNSFTDGLRAGYVRMSNVNLINNNKGYVYTNTNSSYHSSAYSLTAADNITHEIEFLSSSINHQFFGNLNIGSGLSRCAFGSGTSNLGLSTANCLQTGSSLVNRGEGLNSSNLFEGFKNDAMNAHGSSGNSGISYVSISDYFSFENVGKVWSRYNSTFTWPNSNLNDTCTTGLCGIFDYNYKANASNLKSANGVFVANQACPSSIKGTVNQEYLQTSSSFFKALLYANEYLIDGVGNDNGLCEANEICYFNPNSGVYLVEPEKFTQTCNYDADGDADLVGITIFGQ